MEEIDTQDMENGKQTVIEKYLRQELPEAERRSFEQKMDADPALKREVEMYARAFRALREKGREELKERFREKDKAWLESGRRSAAGRSRRFVRMGFGVLLLGLAGLFLWFNNKNPTSPPPPAENLPDTLENQLKNAIPLDTTFLAPPVATEEKQAPSPAPPPKKTQREPNHRQLFADHFQPFKDETMNVSVRTPGNELKPFDLFQQAYWDGRHEEALAAFEAMSAALKGNDNLLFVKANSLLATGKAEEAAGILEGILANGRSRYLGEAKWYLTLAYLKNGEKEKAVSLLKAIAGDEKSARRGEAEKLLEKVR